MGEEDPSQLFELGFGMGEGGSEDESAGSGPNSGNPPSPPTTCFSPVFSAKNSSSPGSSSSSSIGPPGTKERLNDTAFDVSNLFSPYSTALSVTIAIGKFKLVK